MSIHVRDNMPAVGLKAFRGIVGEPAIHVTIDGDAVVIPERDQLTQTQRTRQRTGFMRNTFHQATITEEHIGIVIHDGMSFLVKFCR